jgi:nucleoside-diphosphate-sugar epimerase
MSQASAEYARFLAARQRRLCLPEAALAERLAGKSVLVTGGTGCIGSALMAQLAACRPARLASVARHLTAGWPAQEGARYLVGDVRDRARLEEVIADVRPDVIFHLAAQRSPALAEVEVHRTVSTNVLGARSVLAAARDAGTAQVVMASTGKALRPYSPEVYTASKRAAEWLGTRAAADGLLVSAARFTHVTGNSIIHRRLLAWADDPDAVVRLHSDSIGFYVQSALESAQLLLIALLGATPGQLRVHAITDLGWPVSLPDMTRGLLAERGSRVPVVVSGYDPGYEETPFPGLYDPATAGDVSPLLNAFEAAALTSSPCPLVDAFALEMADLPASVKLLGELEAACADEPDRVRPALDDLSWSLLEAALALADPGALRRSAALAAAHQGMTPVHRRISGAVADALSP